MLIEHLTLTAFRSYPSVRLFTEGRSVVLTGNNGSGKTNLLEAVSLLIPGRGLRRAKGGDLYHHPFLENPEATPHWGVAATLKPQGGEKHIAPLDDPRIGTSGPRQQNTTSNLKEWQGRSESRKVVINGESKSQEALNDYLKMVWLTPQIERVLCADSTTQKQFWDQLIAQQEPAHRGRMTAYRKLAQQRLKLLTNDLSKKNTQNDIWLTTLEKQMAEVLSALSDRRLSFLKRLTSLCERQENPFPVAVIQPAPKSLEERLCQTTALQLEEEIAQRLFKNRQSDAESRQTGGHFHLPFTVLHRKKNLSAALCSTGEQKALLIHILLAYGTLIEEQTNHRPLYLLDEVGAHLDQKRRETLFSLLIERETQLWLSGTDPHFFDSLHKKARFFHCESKKLHLLHD